MAKMTKAEWKKEGEKLKALLIDAKKKDQNFSLVELKEGMALLAHPLHPVEKMITMARKTDGAKKSNCVGGRLQIDGKLIVFNCAEEKLPGGMDVKFKNYLKKADHGSWKAEFKMGVEVANGAGDDSELKEKLAADLKHMNEVFKLSYPNMSEPDAKSIQMALKTILGLINSGDLTGAQNSMNKLTILTGVDGQSPLKAIAFSSKPTGKSGSGGGEAERKKELKKQFDALKPDLRDVVAKAEGDQKAELGDLIKSFDRSLKAGKLDDAENALKTLEAKVEEAKSILAQIGKKIDELGEDLKEKYEEAKEIAKEKAKEELAELAENVKEGAKDIAQGIGDAFGVLSEEDEKAKSKLKDTGLTDSEQMQLVKMNRDDPKAIDNAVKLVGAMKKAGISDARKMSLVKLGQSNPKAFASAVKTIAAFDKKHGEVDSSPAGLKKAVEEANVARKANSEAAAAHHAQKKIVAAAEAERKKKEEELAAAQQKQQEAQDALDAFKASLGDPKKMTEAERKKAAEEGKKLTDALEAAKGVVGTATEALKAATDAKNAEEQKRQDLHNVWVEKWNAKEAAEKKKTAVESKKALLDSIQFGALSPDAGKPMKPEAAEKMIGAFSDDPELAAEALKMAASAPDPNKVAEGAAVLCDQMKNGFKDKDGNAGFAKEEDSRKYAERALKMGAAMGGDYFAELQGYIKDGGLKDPDPCSVPRGTSWKKLEQKRAKHVGDAMLDENGKISPDSPKAKKALADMKFHPGSLADATPGMNMHFDKMAKTLKDPEHGPKCQKVLDGITAPPTKDNALELMSRSSGKSKGDITAGDVKNSVMSAMFTPLDQGPVGSCFATGPARKLLTENPSKAMQGYTDIATKGNFTTAQGKKIPAVTRLPENDNPLMRSFEYTVATAGAQVASSREEKRFNKSLFGANPPGKNFSAMRDIVVDDGKWYTPDDEEKWLKIRNELQKTLKKEIEFRYNPTSKIEKSGDGSSTKGNFEITRLKEVEKDGKKVTERQPITTKADFVKHMKELALKSVGSDVTKEQKEKIVKLVESDEFIDSVCPGKYKPWELAGGGFSDAVSTALNGGAAKYNYMQNAKGKLSTDDEADRTEDLLGKMLDTYKGRPEDMLDIVTDGIHAFSGLPNHPSLDKLKNAKDKGKAIEEHLLDPGEKIAETKLPPSKAAYLYDKEITKIIDSWKPSDEEREMLEEARTKAPTTEMTPDELAKHIDTTLEEMKKIRSKRFTDSWKKREEKDGKTISDEKYQKELAEWKKAFDDKLSNSTDTVLAQELGSPEFVVADTNWGNKDGHTYFVIIADPRTGEPRMMKKQMPSGELSDLPEDWANTGWALIE